MTGFVSRGSGRKKAAGGRAESTIQTSPVGAASSYAPHRLQQPISAAGVTKIHVKYQSVI
jgi:hypothetical protein